MTHDLKCWPTYFENVVVGIKPFEMRTTEDRTFNVGDRIRLREWTPHNQSYTGREIIRTITYILSDKVVWNDKPAAVLGLSRPESNVWVLQFHDYESTDLLGIYTSKELAQEDFAKLAVGHKADRCSLVEWTINKYDGAKYNSWDKEARIGESNA